MNLPFTAEQFFGLFGDYNQAVWPAQVAIYLLAAWTFYLVFKPGKSSGKIISAILAAFWLWMGIAYHWAFFTEINPAAKLFGAVFVLQGLLFIFTGLIATKLQFAVNNNWRSYLGLGLMIFGPVIYPLLGLVLGHAYPNSPTFGLPCPTTIFTFGALLLAVKPPKYVAILPFLWSLLGFTAAISLGVGEDVSLLIAGLIGFGLIIFDKKPAVNVITAPLK